MQNKFVEIKNKMAKKIREIEAELVKLGDEELEPDYNEKYKHLSDKAQKLYLLFSKAHQKYEKEQTEDNLGSANFAEFSYHEAKQELEDLRGSKAGLNAQLTEAQNAFEQAKIDIIKNLSPSNLDKMREKEFFQWKKTSYNDAMLSNLPDFSGNDLANKRKLFDYLNSEVDTETKQTRAQNWGLLNGGEMAGDDSFRAPKDIIVALEDRKNILHKSAANVTMLTTTTERGGCTITRDIVKFDELMKNLPVNEKGDDKYNLSSLEQDPSGSHITIKNTKLEQGDVIATKFEFAALENGQQHEGYLTQDAKGKVTNPMDTKQLSPKEKSLMAYEAAFLYLIMNDPKKTVFITVSDDPDYDRKLVAALYLLRGVKLDIGSTRYPKTLQDGRNLETCQNPPTNDDTMSYGMVTKDLAAEKKYIEYANLELPPGYGDRDSQINKDARKNIDFLQTHKAERTAYFKDQLKTQTQGKEGVKTVTFGLDREIKLENTADDKTTVEYDTDVIEGPKGP